MLVERLVVPDLKDEAFAKFAWSSGRTLSTVTLAIVRSGGCEFHLASSERPVGKQWWTEYGGFLKRK